MMKNILRGTVLTLLLGFLIACDNNYTSNEPDFDDNRNIYFSLNTDNEEMVMKSSNSSASLVGMQWKILCFDDDHKYLLEEKGTINNESEPIKLSVPKGKAYRFLFLCATSKNPLPTLNVGDSYWDLESYSPKLPLADPMSMLANSGEKDGTIRVTASTSNVFVKLSPRAARIIVQNKIDPVAAISINSITFENAAKNAPFFNIEPRDYADNESIPPIERGNYKLTPEKGEVCYILPDLCNHSSGMTATIQITNQKSETKDIPILLPKGLSLNLNGGKTYYIEITSNSEGQLSATWATRTTSKTLKVVTQNLWGKNAATVIDYFNKIDADVLCGQECYGFSDSEISAAGFYVHSHSNNGQVRCNIISRHPFVGTTPNRYGVYIDLGDGIKALVMNCHGEWKPYGPYQLNGIDYQGFPATNDVEHVIKTNQDARKGMVDKLLEDISSSSTPFISVSGDFNEPSWLDWTEESVAAGITSHAIKWPTTHALWKNGLKGDAYRTIHPDPVTHPGTTWTPFPEPQDTKDRIDLILYLVSPNTKVAKCGILGEAANTSDIVISPWVFDHRGVRAEFVYTK